ncbi:MAG: polysaccharide deacetylase family protein [Alphaproteobacteria bacterium]
MRNTKFRLVFALFCLAVLSFAFNMRDKPVYADDVTAPFASGESSAVILNYVRIDEDSFAGSSLRLDDFRAHLREIQQGGYNVMALPDLIAALRAGEPLPRRTIAITFEGAFQSAYKKAMPLLLRERIPFTVLYASYNAERESSEYMSWNDLKSLARNDAVTLGILPAIYTYPSDNSLAENKRLVNTARQEYRAQFGSDPTLFSYPFGEYALPFKRWMEEQGFIAALGQQSGVAHAQMDFLNVPRFTLTEGFNDLERFQMITNALPIPARDIEPEDQVLSTDTPLFGFSVPDSAADILSVTECFISGQGRANTIVAGKTRLEIRPAEPLTDERIRINCTANSGTAEDPVWHWFGMMYRFESVRAADEESGGFDLESGEALRESALNAPNP